VTERDFDIWLHGFAPETREEPPRALCRVFGIPHPAAEALLASLPRIVKRDATLAQAERIVQALEAIGGHAEAVPTKIVVAPVVLVGQPLIGQAITAPQATIVRHAAPNVQRAPITASSTTGSAETVRLGTQELAAYFAPLVQHAPGPHPPDVYSGAPHDTLVEPTPSWAEPEAQPAPRWADIELSAPDDLPVPVTAAIVAPPRPVLELSPAAAPTMAAATAPELEITRNAHDWLESVAHLPALSLEPPAAKLLSSSPPQLNNAAWQNPMELPAFDAPPPHGLTMRTAAERTRARSIRPAAAPGGRVRSIRPSLGDGLAQLARGEVHAMARAQPSLAFVVVLIGTTLAFMVAYAAL
jgi:hypothetical protein